jgi:hypothetical protein
MDCWPRPSTVPSPRLASGVALLRGQLVPSLGPGSRALWPTVGQIGIAAVDLVELYSSSSRSSAARRLSILGADLLALNPRSVRALHPFQLR